MFHRIVMGVIDMLVQVLLVPDDVVPKSKLPETPRLHAVTMTIFAGESQFDDFDNVGETIFTRVHN